MRMQDSNPAASNEAAETYKQQNIRFNDQVDVVFELQPTKAAAK